MKVYIAYKFSNIQNKQALREEIQSVAITLEGKGHETFILGRDLQNWKDFTHPMHRKMRKILKELRSSDVVFAYVNSAVFSRGLLFEMFFAKLLGKPIILALRDDIKDLKMEKWSTKVYRYKRLEDLDSVDLDFN